MNQWWATEVLDDRVVSDRSFINGCSELSFYLPGAIAIAIEAVKEIFFCGNSQTARGGFPRFGKSWVFQAKTFIEGNGGVLRAVGGGGCKNARTHAKSIEGLAVPASRPSERKRNRRDRTSGRDFSAPVRFRNSTRWATWQRGSR